MADQRVVQCFGIKRRPGKADKVCRKQFLWIAKGASSGNFGRKGPQACPGCGTLPDFRHPVNRYLGGTMTQEEAQAMLRRDYDENWMKKQEE